MSIKNNHSQALLEYIIKFSISQASSHFFFFKVIFNGYRYIFFIFWKTHPWRKLGPGKPVFSQRLSGDRAALSGVHESTQSRVGWSSLWIPFLAVCPWDIYLTSSSVRRESNLGSWLNWCWRTTKATRQQGTKLREAVTASGGGRDKQQKLGFSGSRSCQEEPCGARTQIFEVQGHCW